MMFNCSISVQLIEQLLNAVMLINCPPLGGNKSPAIRACSADAKDDGRIPHCHQPPADLYLSLWGSAKKGGDRLISE
jgi:hypothetical protein